MKIYFLSLVVLAITFLATVMAVPVELDADAAAQVADVRGRRARARRSPEPQRYNGGGWYGAGGKGGRG